MSSIGVLRLRAGVGLLECIQISFGRGFELREIRIGFVLVLLDRLARFHNHFVASLERGRRPRFGRFPGSVLQARFVDEPFRRLTQANVWTPTGS